MNKVQSAIAIATENIASEIGKSRIKQSEIAKKTGVSANTISKIKMDIEGTSNPKVEILLAIWIVGLGKSADDLFKKEGASSYDKSFVSDGIA